MIRALLILGLLGFANTLAAQLPPPSLVEIAEKHLGEVCETFKASTIKDPQFAALMRPALKQKIENRCDRFEAAKKSRAKSKLLVSILREEWQDNAKRLLVLAYVDQKVNFESEKKYDLNFERLEPMLKGAYKEYESPGLAQPYVLAVPPKCSEFATPKTTVSTLDLPDASIFKEMPEMRKKQIKKYLSTITVKCKDVAGGYTFYALNVIGNAGDIDVWAIDEKKEIRHIKDGNR